MKFVLTISKGLEELALEELGRIISGDGEDEDDATRTTTTTCSWREQGPSGSQLQVTLSSKAQLKAIVENLRFVEAIYLVLQSFPIQKLEQNEEPTAAADEDFLLKDLHQSLTSQLSRNRNNTLKSLQNSIELYSEVVQPWLKGKDVGLEALPGELMTLDFQQEESAPSSPSTSATTNDFVVNTVYTRPSVAKAVVECILSVVQKQLGDKDHTILYLDAGAGTGALLEHLPKGQRIGVDIVVNEEESNPLHIQQADFLQVDRAWIEQHTSLPYQHLVVVSNPPFTDSSRGNFAGISKFIHHAQAILQAKYMGIICPTAFARERVWNALGLTSLSLVARALLPSNAFYIPSSSSDHESSSSKSSGPSLNASLLIFDLQSAKTNSAHNLGDSSTKDITVAIEAKRHKGVFPYLRTAMMKEWILHELNEKTSHPLLDRNGTLPLLCKLLQHKELSMELHLNPHQPLALVNSNARRFASGPYPHHSLGWLSTSVKPALARAMCQWANGSSISRKGRLLIDACCGEGTLELEVASSNFLVIAGDVNAETLLLTKRKLQNIPHQCVLDLVQWDAQDLPLRDGIADIFLGDLPIMGGVGKRQHQQANLKGVSQDASLQYGRVAKEAIRILQPSEESSRAVLLSADHQALRYHAVSKFHQWTLLQNISINMGGLQAKAFVLERCRPAWKDISVWVENNERDYSRELYRMAIEATSCYQLNECFQLEETSIGVKESSGRVISSFIVERVEMVDSFRPGKNNPQQLTSHCYRFFFHHLISNPQAKILEKRIRRWLAEHKPVATSLEGMWLR